MNEGSDIADEQAALWNGTAGHAWRDEQEPLGRMFQPIQDMLADPALFAAGDRVLDVGCGTGGITVAIARLTGAEGNCLGIDISEPMLAAARANAERERVMAQFVRADAQTYAFEPESFDKIVSRFGVMFFENPRAAFRNLRRATKPNGELRFVVWRGADENPFMTTAERAAAFFVKDLPGRRPDGPGQLAFADPDKVRAIAEYGGWTGIDLEPIDVACSLPEKDLVRYFTRLGPLGAVFHQIDAPAHARVVEAVRAAFEPYVQGVDVRFNAACWIVRARANP